MLINNISCNLIKYNLTTTYLTSQELGQDESSMEMEWKADEDDDAMNGKKFTRVYISFSKHFLMSTFTWKDGVSSLMRLVVIIA